MMMNKFYQHITK